MGKGKSTAKSHDEPSDKKSGKKAQDKKAQGKKAQGKKKSDTRSGDKKAAVAKLPKKKCCESKTRCGRCPLRMLKEGTLPDGYTVHRRKLVKVSELAKQPAAKKKQSAA